MKTFFNKKSFKVALTVSLVALFISSCSKKDNYNPAPIEGDTQIKVVNAVEGSNPQDFYQNDTKLTITPVAYGESSANFNMRAGNSTVTFRNATSGAVSATINANGVYPNTSYILFYSTNGTGSGEIKPYFNDNAVVAGKVKLRFINLGTSATTVNVIAAGGLALFNGLEYPNSTTYTSIDANVDLNVKVIGSTTTTTIPGSSLEAGKIYTIWLSATNANTVQYHIVQQ